MNNIVGIDADIVEFLQHDATATNAAIAAKLGVSEATVRRRKAKLEEEGYIRIVGAINMQKLGLGTVAIIGVQASPNKVAAIENQLKKFAEILFLGPTTGSYDLMLEAWFHSSEELANFRSQKLAKVEGIQKADVFTFLRLSKYYGWSGGLYEAPDLEEP